MTGEDEGLDHRDPHTGMTLAEMRAEADRLESEATDPGAWKPVEAESDPNPRSVHTVRLSREESAAISRAAATAGLPMSTFIRDAAVAAARSEFVDLPKLRKALIDMEKVVSVLHQSVPPGAAPAA